MAQYSIKSTKLYFSRGHFWNGRVGDWVLSSWNFFHLARSSILSSQVAQPWAHRRIHSKGSNWKRNFIFILYCPESKSHRGKCDLQAVLTERKVPWLAHKVLSRRHKALCQACKAPFGKCEVDFVVLQFDGF